MRRCFRLPPGSSTATATCWHCAAMPKLPAQRLPFTRRWSAPKPPPVESNWTPAVTHRRRRDAGCSTTRGAGYWEGGDHEGYGAARAGGERFYPASRRYWPALPDGALMPSYSGMRPKIVPPAVARQDCLMQGPRDHGVDGLINLFGIESPGLTSSLAIADHVGDLASA